MFLYIYNMTIIGSIENKVVNDILKKIFGGEKNAYVQEGYGSFGDYIAIGGGN